MRLGFHMPIAGSLEKAIIRAERTGSECLQIFSASPRTWRVKELSPQAAASFAARLDASGLAPLAVHLSYLPNLASLDSGLLEKSRQALAAEMERAAALHADFLVFHPGHATGGRSMEKAWANLSETLALAGQGQTSAGGPRLLVENTAGRAGELGADLARLGRGLEEAERLAGGGLNLGLCLDTAHAFGAGYALHTRQGLEALLAEIDGALGLDRLGLVHLNDSLGGLGSRRDRHAPRTGEGRIGAEGLARLVNHPAFVGLGGVMETPRMGEQDDISNLERVKSWRQGLA